MKLNSWRVFTELSNYFVFIPICDSYLTMLFCHFRLMGDWQTDYKRAVMHIN